MQQIIQAQTAEGPAETRACMRDLDDSLRKALHDKHKLGQSKQDSLYFQLWDLRGGSDPRPGELCEARYVVTHDAHGKHLTLSDSRPV